MLPNDSGQWTSLKVWAMVRTALEQEDDLVVYDLETTGLSSDKDQIIEIAAIRYKIKDFALMEMERLHEYINPGRPLPAMIAELTGLSDAFLADKPGEEVVIDEIENFFYGAIVCGYNVATFDEKFMGNLFERHGITYENKGIIDVYHMARERLSKTDTGIENYKLETVASFHGINFDAHKAMEDVRATAELFQIFIKEYLKLENMSTPKGTGTLRPDILQIYYWDGFGGYTRTYVETSVGKLYYNRRNHCWSSTGVDLSELDMEWIEEQSWKLTGCCNEQEFCLFKDKWMAAA